MGKTRKVQRGGNPLILPMGLLGAAGIGGLGAFGNDFFVSRVRPDRFN